MRSTDGDRSPAGVLIYSNNFFALSCGEIPCKSSSCPFNVSYDAGVGPEMLGHTNLNRSFGSAWIRRAAFVVSEERFRRRNKTSACANQVSGSLLSYAPISNGFVSVAAAAGGVVVGAEGGADEGGAAEVSPLGPAGCPFACSGMVSCGGVTSERSIDVMDPLYLHLGQSPAATPGMATETSGTLT